VVIIVNVEGKSRVKKHLHTVGGDVERWHEKRPPAGDARSGQVKPALLLFFLSIDCPRLEIAIYIMKERTGWGMC